MVQVVLMDSDRRDEVMGCNVPRERAKLVV